MSLTQAILRKRVTKGKLDKCSDLSLSPALLA
jgi:hypothetical protein